MQIQFSIIIPAKNEEANIGRCLDSIYAIDGEGISYEVIVVDNGSNDLTVPIAREKGARVFERPGITIAALRNCGARAANGRIFAFLDADCSVGKGWLTAASKYLEDTTIVAFGCPSNIPNDATWVQRAWFQVRGRPQLFTETQWLETANMFVRKECFVDIHGFDESLVTCEDYDISKRLTGHGRLISDCRIEAVHHREPSTVKDFFKKEIWRGTSNYIRIKSHRITVQEIPSIVFPLIYCLLTVFFVLLSLSGLVYNNHNALQGAMILLIIWQLPVLFLALWKSIKSASLQFFIQLYFLLNIYFLARGYSLVTRCER